MRQHVCFRRLNGPHPPIDNPMAISVGCEKKLRLNLLSSMVLMFAQLLVMCPIELIRGGTGLRLIVVPVSQDFEMA
jgi:hypothetical protein